MEAVDGTGQTALMYAAVNDATDSLKLLINAGAKRATKTNDGKTALQLAKEAENSAAVDILLSK